MEAREFQIDDLVMWLDYSLGIVYGKIKNKTKVFCVVDTNIGKKHIYLTNFQIYPYNENKIREIKKMWNEMVKTKEATYKKIKLLVEGNGRR